MRPRMVADQVSFLPGPAHDLRMLVGALAHHKKRGFHILFTQQVEQPGRIHRVRPIVEGQRHAAFLFHLRTVGHQPLIARMKEQVKHHPRAQRIKNCHQQRREREKG